MQSLQNVYKATVDGKGNERNGENCWKFRKGRSTLQTATF
jgi:hypothetical protein